MHGGGGFVNIVWTSSKSQTSAYYIAHSIYNDEVTAWHTGRVMRNIIAQLQNENFAANYDWTSMGIAYLVTKPLMKSIPIVDELIRPKLPNLKNKEKKKKILKKI
jgi:hypothetical protein